MGNSSIGFYRVTNKEHLSLPDWLDNHGFRDNQGTCITPDPNDVVGFNDYIQQYKKELTLYGCALP